MFWTKVLSRSAVMLFLLLITSMLFFPAAVKAYAESAVPVIRVSGADRYATAAAISREGWKESEYILLSTGEGDDKFADALAGSPLSFALNAPMLLTATDKLSFSAQEEIIRLKAKKAVLLGGSSVVSDNVERKLMDMGLTTERLWGDNRILTAIRIADKMRDLRPFTKVFLTSGEEFQYAMMIAPFASKNGIPVLFTEKDALNSQVAESFAKWGVNEVHIIGNTNVISQQVEDSLKGMNLSVSRVSGTDISDTNVKVINTYSMDLSHIALARNDIFADGLAGASFAAIKNMPVLLTGSTSAPSPVSGFITSSAFESAYVFGGPGAVSDYIIPLIRKGDLGTAVFGNTPGCINSGGLVVEKDGWIYYHNVSQGGKLYKVKADGTGKTEICSDTAANINVIGDRIYYINLNDNSKIYMIRTDGTGKIKINDDESWNVSVIDNWIYYINMSDNGRIYKIASDGSNRFKLNDTNSRYMNVNLDNIYYVNPDDARAIYRIQTNSPTVVHKLLNIYAWDINVCEGWIYFSNDKEDNSLYAVNYEGTKINRLSDDSAFDIQVLGDTIYYSNASDNDKLYKIKADGTGRAKVYDGSAYLISIAGDWIYFFKDKEAAKLYKIKLDGTGLAEVD